MKKQAYAGLFMVALATLMYEILITRIFSVDLWYHFAFMAISIAMFGMTVGAILVYLFPQYFTQERAKYHLALSSLLLALSVIASFLTHLSIPVLVDNRLLSFVGFYALGLTYLVISIPFTFSGICVCLALTKFPQYVSKLYAADLAGAGIGCVLLIYTLKITDGVTAVFTVALFAGIGSILFAVGAEHLRLRRIALVSSAILALFILVNTALLQRQRPLIRLMWVRGETNVPALYEKWNSFARITVSPLPEKLSTPFGWGFSSTYTPDQKIDQMGLNIDAGVFTSLTAFNGNTTNLQYLKYDITNFVHYIRANARMFVIGTGGGRDILSALVFNQRSVIGVEINEDIIKAVNQRFGDFTGHLDRNPKVTFINDEARSYLARSEDKFDIIQSSLIDTWAATSAGAYVFTESSLYTVEAWEIFLKHLSSNGILTFSRWSSAVHYSEYRLTTLAYTALTRFGVRDPRDHIVIVQQFPPERPGGEFWAGISTILVSSAPFSSADLDTIEQVARRMQFSIILSPKCAFDSTIADLASGKNLERIYAKSAENIAPPTDDSPFFFQPFKMQNLFGLKFWRHGLLQMGGMAASMLILVAMLFIVLGLTFLCIIVPLWLTTQKAALKGATSLFLYFASIGLGFMLIEISQMQRLIIFLGHPTYGLSVVLFALLLSSGLGSYATRRIDPLAEIQPALIRLLLLLGMLIIFGLITPLIIREFQGSTTTIRIIAATLILFPLGIFMGMAFPLGMKIAANRKSSLTPWLWGINGATSVCASVIAMVIALTLGITTAFWVGFSCYVIASISFAWVARRTA